MKREKLGKLREMWKKEVPDTAKALYAKYL